MKQHNDRAIIFKPYQQNQPILLPPSLDELIAANHPVRIVSKVIGQLDIQPLINEYKTGGTSSFHPRMLSKVLVFTKENIFSIVLTQVVFRNLSIV